MIKRMDTADPAFGGALDTLLAWEVRESPEVARIAAELIAEVRANGDVALLRLSRRFDGVQAERMADLEIGPEALEEALASLPGADRETLETAASRIRAYHERQPTAAFEYTDEFGNLLGSRVTPLERVGIYVPGGQASYPSTVLMTAVPARVAGVGEIIATVPTPKGQRNAHVLAAMVDALDENIGRVLDALDETGKADDTLVVFTSDNGGLATAEGSPTCNAPLAEGKGWMYEGGTREPLIVRWPGRVAAGSRCQTPVTSPDFYPTLLEAAGLPPRPEQHVDGVSFAPLLEGGGALEREAIFWHYPHYGNQGGTPGSSVRRGDWKLIEFYEDGRRELYNLRDDLSEDRDLAAGHPDLARDLHEELAAWRESVAAKIPERNG